MTPAREIRIEGYTPEELLAALDEETEAVLFSATALVFRAGSATILGQFSVQGDRLVVELAQIEGGGEGVDGFERGVGFAAGGEQAQAQQAFERALEGFVRVLGFVEKVGGGLRVLDSAAFGFARLVAFCELGQS